MFNKFFRCLSCEDTARHTCVRWCRNGDFLRPVFSASRVQHISHMRSKFALRPHTMCGSIVDIHSPTAEIRRGKKERKKKRR